MHNAAVSFTLGFILKVIPSHSKTQQAAFIKHGPAVGWDAGGAGELAFRAAEDDQTVKKMTLAVHASTSNKRLSASAENRRHSS